MAFTQITITAHDITPTGTAAEGTLTATLSARMQNAGEVIDPTPVTGMFVEGQLMNASGEQPFELAANNDVGTAPIDPPASYEFVLQLDDAPLVSFTAIVPATAPAGTVDLTALQNTAS